MYIYIFSIKKRERLTKQVNSNIFYFNVENCSSSSLEKKKQFSVLCLFGMIYYHVFFRYASIYEKLGKDTDIEFLKKKIDIWLTSWYESSYKYHYLYPLKWSIWHEAINRTLWVHNSEVIVLNVLATPIMYDDSKAQHLWQIYRSSWNKGKINYLYLHLDRKAYFKNTFNESFRELGNPFIQNYIKFILFLWNRKNER